MNHKKTRWFNKSEFPVRSGFYEIRYGTKNIDHRNEYALWHDGYWYLIFYTGKITYYQMVYVPFNWRGLTKNITRQKFRG